MKVWIVMDGDYDGDWIVAVYATKDAADQHARAHPRHFRPQEHEVRDAYDEEYIVQASPLNGGDE